jgi:membrane-associated protease RseP (regulator of RpoE activity)
MQKTIRHIAVLAAFSALSALGFSSAEAQIVFQPQPTFRLGVIVVPTIIGGQSFVSGGNVITTTEAVFGVKITYVEPNSPAQRWGLKVGDVIHQINRRPIASVEELRQAIAYSGGVLYTIFRDVRTNRDVFRIIYLR